MAGAPEPAARRPLRVLLLPLFLLFAACAACAPTDAALANCLSYAQRTRLVEAAESLRLVDKGSQPDRVLAGGRALPLDEWRNAFTDDFERSCSAVAPPPSPPHPLITALISLFPVLGGASIAWLTANWRDERNRGKQQADALRTASTMFTAAIRAYCDAQVHGSEDGRTPSYKPVREARDGLTNQLAKTASLRRRWSAPVVLRSAANADPLGDELTTGWEFNDKSSKARERGPRAELLRAAADELDRRVDILARALERPGQPHGELRAAFPAEVSR